MIQSPLVVREDDDSCYFSVDEGRALSQSFSVYEGDDSNSSLNADVRRGLESSFFSTRVLPVEEPNPTDKNCNNENDENNSNMSDSDANVNENDNDNENDHDDHDNDNHDDNDNNDDNDNEITSNHDDAGNTNNCADSNDNDESDVNNDNDDSGTNTIDDDNENYNDDNVQEENEESRHTSDNDNLDSDENYDNDENNDTFNDEVSDEDNEQRKPASSSSLGPVPVPSSCPVSVDPSPENVPSTASIDARASIVDDTDDGSVDTSRESWNNESSFMAEPSDAEAQSNRADGDSEHDENHADNVSSSSDNDAPQPFLIHNVSVDEENNNRSSSNSNARGEPGSPSRPHLNVQFIDNMWASLKALPTIRLSILGKPLDLNLDLEEEVDKEEAEEDAEAAEDEARDVVRYNIGGDHLLHHNYQSNSEHQRLLPHQQGQVQQVHGGSVLAESIVETAEVQEAIAELILSESFRLSDESMRSNGIYRRLRRDRSEFISCTVVMPSRNDDDEEEEARNDIDVGLTFEKSDDNNSNNNSATPPLSYLKLSSIDPDGLFKVSPLRLGDRIQSINHKPCINVEVETAYEYIRETEAGQCVTIVVQNVGGSSDLVESMIEKPTPETLMGIGLRSDAFGSLWLSRIDSNKIISNSLLNVGDRIIAINNEICEHLHSSTAAMKVKDTPRYVYIISSTSGTNGIVLGAGGSQSFFDVPDLENGIIQSSQPDPSRPSSPALSASQGNTTITSTTGPFAPAATADRFGTRLIVSEGGETVLHPFDTMDDDGDFGPRRRRKHLKCMLTIGTTIIVVVMLVAGLFRSS